MVFHFNKKHLEDPSIPMWVLKARGESYYVDHVECELPWSTKETPDNSHTKGSIKVKRCLVTIDEDNCAHITALTKEDEARLNGKAQPIRVITSFGSKLKNFIKNQKHGDVQMFGGGCSTTWYVTEFYSQRVLLLAQLAIPHLRVLMPNEDYYKWYDAEKKDSDYEPLSLEEDEEDWWIDDLYEN